MLTKISKLHLSYSTKSCRHTLSPNEKILRHIYFFVAFCDNGDRQREPFKGNPFPNKPWFLHVCSTSTLKTLWENFSFSHSVFYLFEELSAIFIR